MELEWGTYKHFPYERELALREASALLSSEVEVLASGNVRVPSVDFDAARLLTYFSSVSGEDGKAATLQHQLERSATPSTRRQSTRYSVHGLHEYRGKFNPQVCAALINILGVATGGSLLDPFCGSGTTLVEAAHRGLQAVGTDLNPLAVFIANTKLQALATPTAQLHSALQRIRKWAPTAGIDTADDTRRAYLEAWFEPHALLQIERVRSAISCEAPPLSDFFYVVASNLLRDFSLQDPADLRIRRRESANITMPFLDAFHEAATDSIGKLERAQKIVGIATATGRAWLIDNRTLAGDFLPGLADAAITSPPYATALPYIDTQRLSLVWLRLLTPEEIGAVDAELVGSREMGAEEKRSTLHAMLNNAAGLPDAQAELCLELQRALGPHDGFRRKAVPSLIYRYFHHMGETFRAVRRCLKPEAPFALIVGHNHTVLGGTRFDIDTPAHLAALAAHKGWAVREVTPLQAYQRYGLHASNAVKAETLVVLRAG